MSNTIDTSLLGQLGYAQRSNGLPDDQLGQEDFLRLMLAQLDNQDPFAPMESGEFLGQLAQFGTVSGISEMKQSLEGLVGSLSGNQTLQAATLVNRNVLVPTREGWLPPEGELAGAVDVPDGVNNLSLEIADLGGTLVQRIALPAPVAGRTGFTWDGTLADGTAAEPGFYELRAVGDSAGEAVAMDVLVSGRVESVALGGQDGSVKLTVTGLGTVDVNSLKGIL